MASGNVIITFKTVPDNICPSSTQDFVNLLYRLVSAQVEFTGELVRIEFGNFQPGFCPETCEEFIDELNKIVRGYVVETGQRVRVTFAQTECCWNDPQLFVNNLQAAVSAYVI